MTDEQKLSYAKEKLEQAEKQLNAHTHELELAKKKMAENIIPQNQVDIKQENVDSVQIEVDYWKTEVSKYE